MKKFFEAPDMRLTHFTTEDVITASGGEVTNEQKLEAIRTHLGNKITDETAHILSLTY